jgi:hypothetical protein
MIGIDNSLSAAATEFLIPFFRSRVRMEEGNLYDLREGRFGRFDVILLAGSCTIFATLFTASASSAT